MAGFFAPLVGSAVIAATIVLALAGPGQALAGERPAWRNGPRGDRFWLGVGLYAPKLDTQVRFDSSNGILGIELDLGDDTEFAGEILQINSGIAYKASENVDIALNYNYFRVDVDVEDPDWMGLLKYEYRGPVLSVSFYF